MDNRFKFRIWDLNEKSWMIDWKKQFAPIWTKYGENIWMVRGSGYITQQFTGLTDKNNKEIYEGDICLIEYYSSSQDKYVKNKDVICFEEGSFIAEWFKKYQSENYGGAYLPDSNKIEIIGNIYENPNLLLDNSDSLS
jgi:uncharacterized phage protein (TIGR01671 family)